VRVADEGVAVEIHNAPASIDQGELPAVAVPVP